MRTHLVEASSGERWLARGLRAVLIGALVAGALSVWSEARALSVHSARPDGLAAAAPVSVAAGPLAARPAADRGDR